jgi:hypothetical protein
MRTSWLLIALAGCALLDRLPLSAADLTRVDRTIAREPAYQTKSPRYCLLVFGPQAKTRVWLVRDGDVLYADRNGNGDLTEPGERYRGTKGTKEVRWTIGDVVEADRRARHTDLQVRFRRGSFSLGLRTADGLRQAVGNEMGPLHFSDRARDAPIVHFAGPLTFLFRTPPKLVSGKEEHFIALVGTAGLGEGTAAYCHSDEFMKVKMVGEVEFPRPSPAAPLRLRCTDEGY